jgi:hypothetical protein
MERSREHELSDLAGHCRLRTAGRHPRLDTFSRLFFQALAPAAFA